MSMISLNEKTAVVTGSTSGIGKQIALSLASAGCRIVLNGIDAQEIAQQAREDMLAAGAAAVVVSNDNLFEAGATATLVGFAREQFGSLDILVNNAGIQHVAPIEAFSDEHWNRIIELNLSVPFRLIRNVLPAMRENGWGRIVNIASVHGLVASAHKSAYVAAKHGLVGLTKTVALETGGQSITCNAICPGYVRTALTETQIEALAEARGTDTEVAAQAFLSQKQPSGDFVSPSDIGAMVVFLCSRSGAQITGSTFTIDGGWTAQ